MTGADTEGRPTLALSVQQPWAWAIVNGYKPIENRTWRTTFRGPLWIHAGRQFDRNGLAFIRANFPTVDLPDLFDAGGIVGRVRMSDCVDSPRTPAQSVWFFGPWGFVFDDAEPLPLYPCRGQLGLFRAEYRAEYNAPNAPARAPSQSVTGAKSAAPPFTYDMLDGVL
jgi:hypothetical protein